MTAIESQAEYQNLVGIKSHQITKEDLVIDPRVASMTTALNLPASFNYKDEYYKKYIK